MKIELIHYNNTNVLTSGLNVLVFNSILLKDIIQQLHMKMLQ